MDDCSNDDDDAAAAAALMVRASPANRPAARWLDAAQRHARHQRASKHERVGGQMRRKYRRR